MVFISRELLSSNLLNIQKSTKVVDYIQDNWSLIPDYWFGAIWSLSNHLPCSILCSYICYKSAFPAYSKEMLEKGHVCETTLTAMKSLRDSKYYLIQRVDKYRLTCALCFIICLARMMNIWNKPCFVCSVLAFDPVLAPCSIHLFLDIYPSKR